MSRFLHDEDLVACCAIIIKLLESRSVRIIEEAIFGQKLSTTRPVRNQLKILLSFTYKQGKKLSLVYSSETSRFWPPRTETLKALLQPDE